MVWLSILLFFPWFCVLSGLYWHFPRQPRNATRRYFDSSMLVLAFVVSISTMHWGYLSAKIGWVVGRCGNKLWQYSMPMAVFWPSSLLRYVCDDIFYAKYFKYCSTHG